MTDLPPRKDIANENGQDEMSNGQRLENANGNPHFARILLVQTCHLPQFFFVAEQLRSRHPQAQIDALLIDDDQVRELAAKLGRFHRTYFHSAAGSAPRDEYDAIALPLLNRGYRGMKRAGLALRGPHFEADFSGGFTPLSRARLVRSYFTPLHRPDDTFEDYLTSFPDMSCNLFLDGTRSSAAEGTVSLLNDEGVIRPRPIVVLCREDRAAVFSELPGIKRVLTYRGGSPGRFLSAWKKARHLNTEVVAGVFSGSRLSRAWQLLLFLLVPARHRLVVNQHMACFYLDRGKIKAMGRTLLAGMRPKGVLFLDTTESPDSEEAIRMLAEPRIAESRPVIVVCRDTRRGRFEGLQGVKEIVTYRAWRPFEKLAALKKATRLTDVLCGVFSGRRTARLHLLFLFALPVRYRLIFNQFLGCFYLTPRSTTGLLRAVLEPVRPFKRISHILFLDLTRSPNATKAVSLLLDPSVVSTRPIVVVCPADRRQLFEDLPGLAAVHTYRRFSVGDRVRIFFRSLQLDTEVIAGVFSGRRMARLVQFFFFFLPARHRLVFNQHLDCFYAEPGRMRPLVKALVESEAKTGEPIVFVDLAGSPRSPAALKKLEDPAVGAHGSVLVLCRNDKAGDYERVPQVRRILTFSPGSLPSLLGGLWRASRFRSGVVATILDGRRLTRLGQLVSLLLPLRHRLVFNQHLDCFYLQPSAIGAFKTALTERDESYERTHSYALLIQTADDAMTIRAAGRLSDPLVARPRPIMVFCRDDKRALFEGLPGVAQVFTYSSGRIWSNLHAIAVFLRTDIEVVAAVFTGTPIYRLQRLLFFAVPARHRLAFNRHLDCFYLNARNWTGIFARDPRAAGANTLRKELRVVSKILLWAPRFLFLVIWITSMKMRRAYTASQK